jgi:RHS repeat-associated protein
MKSRIRLTADDARTHGSSLVVLLVAVGLSLLAFTVLVNAAASNTPATAATGSSSGAGRLGPEILEERTRNSKTFAGPDGRGVVTRVYAGPVHFKGANGDWLEIRSDLERASGGGLRNGRNHYGLELPDRLGSAPVKIGEGGDELSFSLAGAQGTAVATHNEATFADALPGVTVKYAALSNAVKEDLVLSGPDSPTTFTFRVGGSAGLTATKSRDGGIEFRNAAGDVAFALPAPFMFDAAHKPQASGAVSYDIERTGDGWQLTLRADRGWLGAKDRQWPVTVDPTVNFGSNRDCTLDQGNPTSDWCAQTTVRAGICGGVKNNAILNFGIAGQLPKDAVVLSARMFAWESIGTHGVAKPIGVYRMTSAWQNGASWNTKDGVNPWTTAGGDFAAGPEAETTAGTANGTADVRRDWYITKLVQDWVDGSKPDYGVMLKDSAASPVDNVVYFRSSESWASARPYVEVYWEPRVGEGLSYTQNGESLNDRSSYKVNVATGNLEVVSNDINIAGRGLDLPLARYYNSGWANTYGGQFGGGQTADVGKDVWLAATGSPDNALIVYPGTGSAYPFFRKPGLWEWDQPAKLGLNADLKWITTPDTVELTYRGSDLKYVWGYTPYGRRQLLKIRDRNSNENTFAYDANGNMTSMSTSQGKTLTVSSNANGYITRVQDPTGRQWNYEYGINSEWNLVKKYTDPNGKQTLYDWDGPNQLLLKVTTPGGRQTKFAYHPDRKLKSVTRVDNITAQTGPTTTYAYYTGGSPCQAAENRTVVTDPRGSPTNYCSSQKDDRVSRVRDANGNDVDTEYTTFGNVDKITAPGNTPSTKAITDPAWNARNNFATNQDPAGAKSKLDYNLPAQTDKPSDSQNAQGTQFKYGYDTPGNLTATANGASLTLIEARLDYNPDGTIDKAYDGNGKITDYNYYPDGNLKEVVPPAITPSGRVQLGKTTFDYDPLSRVTKVWDAKHQPATTTTPQKVFTYDPLDRVLKVDFADGSWVSFSYDNDGNRTTRAEGSGATTSATTSYAYDDLNRLKQETLPGGATNAYTYDPAGNLKTLTDSGGTVTYDYDAVNLPRNLAEPGGNCYPIAPATPTLCTTFTNTARGQRDVTTYPNGVAVDNDYDLGDKPTSITAKFGSTTLQSFAYTYQDSTTPARDTLLTQSVTDKDNNKTTYSYENSDAGGTSGPDRLIRARTAAAAGGGALVDDYKYWYDKAGNLTQQTTQVGTGALATTTLSYNEGNQLCWKASGTPASTACGSAPTGADVYLYDVNGNLTSGAGRTYGSNVKNQTVSITPSGGTTTALSYLGQSQAELTGIGSTIVQNNALGVGIQSTGGTASYFVRSSHGGLVGEKVGTARHYYVADNLGSIRGLTNSSGALVNTYRYEPYGKLASSTGSVSNPMKFAGGHDTGLGVYHFGARYYDPALGRWTQQDSVDLAGDLREANRYAYVGDDPVDRTDPSGLLTCAVSHFPSRPPLRCPLPGTYGRRLQQPRDPCALPPPAQIGILGRHNCAGAPGGPEEGAGDGDPSSFPEYPRHPLPSPNNPGVPRTNFGPRIPIPIFP